MQLGFVSAILPDLSLEEVFAFAAQHGFDCVEVMCWPKGKAERRYAGVTHIDVTDFTASDAAQVKQLAEKYKVSISGLGYYPNPLSADPAEREVTVEHIKKVIRAAARLKVPVVNTFIGRDQTKSIDENWPLLREVLLNRHLHPYDVLGLAAGVEAALLALPAIQAHIQAAWEEEHQRAAEEAEDREEP